MEATVRSKAAVLAIAAFCLLAPPRPGLAHDEEGESKVTPGGAPGIRFQLEPARCANGKAGDFSCRAG